MQICLKKGAFTNNFNSFTRGNHRSNRNVQQISGHKVFAQESFCHPSKNPITQTTTRDTKKLSEKKKKSNIFGQNSSWKASFFVTDSHTFVSFQWWSETGYQDRSFLPTNFFPEQFEPTIGVFTNPWFFSIPFVFCWGSPKPFCEFSFGAFSAPKICTVLEGCLAKLIRDLGWWADEVYSCWMFSLEDVFLVVDDFLSKTWFLFAELEWGKLHLFWILLIRVSWCAIVRFFTWKKHKNNGTSNRRKRKNKIAKGGNSETLGQRCSTEVVILKSTWIKTDEMAFVGSKNWTVLDKGSSCSKHSPGMPTQLAKWAAPRPARQPCRWDLGQWPSCATDRSMGTNSCWVERWVGWVNEYALLWLPCDF